MLTKIFSAWNCYIQRRPAVLLRDGRLLITSIPLKSQKHNLAYHNFKCQWNCLNIFVTIKESKIYLILKSGADGNSIPSTFLIALGEIISIFIHIFGFHWKIWPIMMFDLHFSLLFFCILCRNSQGQNGGQTSWSVKFFNEIQKYI